MTEEKFNELLRPAAKEYSEQKKVAKRPETQFMAGARWLWDLLMAPHGILFYEQQLREELTDRIGGVEPWHESLITELAEKKARLDTMIADIEREGYLLEKWDKNMNPYKESNPLLVHTKELERTIGMCREHLGLSYKVNPARITESAKKNADENSTVASWMKGRQK